MTTMIIRKEWYDELNGLVPMVNPYFFIWDGVNMVEVDVDEPHFNMVSRELGWML